MLEIIAAGPAIVKPADAESSALAALDRGILVAEYREYGDFEAANAAMLEAWADEAECYDRYASGCYAW